MEYKTKKVTPCGFLSLQGREYFLIKPEPLFPRWERDTKDIYRFLVAPRTKIETIQIEDEGLAKTADIYWHPRHVVIKGMPFIIEYQTDIPELTVLDLEDQNGEEI